jgi:hypothetical protein
MKENPSKWGHGRGCWVEGAKCVTPRFWVRSSYEVAAVRVLEGDPQVLSYEYEPEFECSEGMTHLPDFRVWLIDGSRKIVEVKASWVTELPLGHPKRKQLSDYALLSETFKVPFEVWTEKDVLREHL